MSIRLMSRVWDDAPFDGATLLTLLALTDSANDEGWCWPSITTLMHKTRQGNSTVYRSIAELIESGWLEKYKEDQDGVIQYRVLYPEDRVQEAQIADDVDSPTENNSLPERKISLPQRKRILSQRKPPHPLNGRTVIKATVREPSVTPSPAPPEVKLPATLGSSPDPSPEELQKMPPRQRAIRAMKICFFPYYCEVCEQNPKVYTLTQLRIEKGVARYLECLKKCDGDWAKAGDMFYAAMDALSQSDFHMGRNERGKNGNGKKYVDWVSNLCNSQEKFEKWLVAAPLEEAAYA